MLLSIKILTNIYKQQSTYVLFGFFMLKYFQLEEEKTQLRDSIIANCEPKFNLGI